MTMIRLVEVNDNINSRNLGTNRVSNGDADKLQAIKITVEEQITSTHACGDPGGLVSQSSVALIVGTA